MKTCYRCKETKEYSEFHKNKSKKDGYTTYCKKCQLEYIKSRPATAKVQRNNKRAIATRNRRYAITSEWYDTTLAEQNGCCAICKSSCKTGKALAVDHDHETGKNRGLLCMDCNTALGKFRDNVEILQSAISYLEGQGLRNEAL